MFLKESMFLKFNSFITIYGGITQDAICEENFFHFVLRIFKIIFQHSFIVLRSATKS